MTERLLIDVAIALDRVDGLAWERATDPKNAAKPHWADVTVLELALHLTEEVGELAQAIRRGAGSVAIDQEAGDVVWSTAMLLDLIHRQRNESR